MNEAEYKKRCDALFRKAKSFQLELLFEPINHDPQRLNCLWHGGHIAEVKVSDKLSIDISVCGDVCADLYDEYCNHIERTGHRSYSRQVSETFDGRKYPRGLSQSGKRRIKFVIRKN